jgi:hypothetical protein
MSRNDEDYLPNYGRMSDPVLLAASGGLTELVMFVATFEAKLDNISMAMDSAIAMIDPMYPVVAINSNFGHKCVPGYERFLKLKPGKAVGTRKGQGDRTCFNSALEPVIIPHREGIPASKVYYMKCFPSTGEVQVPGTLLPDMSDGTDAVNAWVDLLNYSGIGDADENSDPLPITVTASRPNMINFKFRIKRASPRIMFDLHCMGSYFNTLEEKKVVEGKACSQKEGDAILDALPHGTVLVPPPFPVRETKPPIEDVKLTFKFGRIRVKIFQRGKVNILGSDSFASAHKIHQYMEALIQTNHAKFVRLQPKSDAERRAKEEKCLHAEERLRKKPLMQAINVEIPTPVYRLTDEELSDVLSDLTMDSELLPLEHATVNDPVNDAAAMINVSIAAATVNDPDPTATTAAVTELLAYFEEFEDSDENTL